MGEAQRLEALRSLSVLDTEPEKGFDDLTRAAALAMDTRIALVSLVDAERQWFKASCGLDIKETARDISFCTHAIEEAEPFFVLRRRAMSALRITRLCWASPLCASMPVRS